MQLNRNRSLNEKLCLFLNVFVMQFEPNYKQVQLKLKESKDSPSHFGLVVNPSLFVVKKAQPERFATIFEYLQNHLKFTLTLP